MSKEAKREAINEEVKKEKKQSKLKITQIVTKKRLALATVILMIIALVGITMLTYKGSNSNQIIDPELLRARTYEQFEEGDENIEGTDNVKFSAFFLRDLNNDGYAEKIKGTCKEIGKEDTLYMEIKVNTEGYLKNAKIQIDGKNFYFQTALPKDNELKENYIGSNIKTIEFENLNNGTQKLINGIVRSGNYEYSSLKYLAIGNNVNNYSRQDNKIILTGTYVSDDGTETEITKEVELEMDWYGITEAYVERDEEVFYDIEKRKDEEKQTVTLDFCVRVSEEYKQLKLKSNVTTGVIPQLEGYNPISVKMIGSLADFSYDENTREFCIENNSKIDENGEITSQIPSSQTYNIQIVYPLEAFKKSTEDTIRIDIPVETYYEGYNNPNEEFNNPYKSNISKATIAAVYQDPVGTVANFKIKIGNFENNRFIVSKEKALALYNSEDSLTQNDRYFVSWNVYTGSNGDTTGLVMSERADDEPIVSDTFIKTDSSEESMEDITTNIGIGFDNIGSILNENGEIRVYDDETDELIVTFTIKDWYKYTKFNPYMYEREIKHIRIETSETKKERQFTVYNIKELNDYEILKKFEREDFYQLQYIKTSLVGYMGGQYINSDTRSALYEAPYSSINLYLSPAAISTQKTEENFKINIVTSGNVQYNEKQWRNGSFLLKLPQEIVNAEINDITIDKPFVNVSNYEIIEKDDNKYIKINTENEIDTEYTVTLDIALAPNPQIETMSRNIELYAWNENTSFYSNEKEDIYDVNNNLNTTENVGYAEKSISLVSPNSLLTNQIVSSYDGDNTAISPQILDLKPIYDENDREKSQVKIGVQMKNNYSSTISDVLVLGKIPFEGNTYALSGNDLGSTFSTTIKNGGIEIPEELNGKVEIYYSEKESPSKDITDRENEWITKDEVENWENIKTYIIDFKDTIIPRGAEYIFYYTVEIPFGVDLNNIAYSHHGIYFSLDTDQGKYRTQVEPNKIGIRISEKYELELTKYESGKEKIVPGATYKVSKLSDDGEVEEAKTSVTNAEGKIIMANLYAEKVYEIKEIKSPEEYELNEDKIKIIGHFDRNSGTLTVEKLEGETKDPVNVEKNIQEDYTAIVKVEDEAKLDLRIKKLDKNTHQSIGNVFYKITGEGFGENGKKIVTGSDGVGRTKGLVDGEEYVLQEIKADGYFLASPIKFKALKSENEYSVDVLEGETYQNKIIEEDDISVVSLVLEDEPLPKYDLNVKKVAKGTETPLEGAKFRLYRENKVVGEYITDRYGRISITDLYVYTENVCEDVNYTLREVETPEGYTKAKDISFIVSKENGELKLEFKTDENEKYNIEENVINLIIEDNPMFKLVKKDGETDGLIPNAKFAIYNAEGEFVPARNSKNEIVGNKEIIDGKEYYVVTTDENGEITADLPSGIYKVVELSAPEQYDITNKEEYVGVGESQEGAKALSFNSIYQHGSNTGGDFYTQSIALTSSGDYYRWSRSYSNYTSYTYFGKYTANNATIWNKYINLSNAIISDIIATSDGGCIVCGGGQGYSSGNNYYFNFDNLTIQAKYAKDGFVIKYSSEGNAEWAKCIGGDGYYDFASSAIETSDGGYLVTAHTTSAEVTLENNVVIQNPNRNLKAIYIKYDANHVQQWVHTEDVNFSFYYSLPLKYVGAVELVNGDYVGYTTDGTILKMNSSGNEVWKRKIIEVGTNYYSGPTNYAIEATKDGGFLVGGNQHLTKCNTNGVIEWQQNITESIYAIKELENNDIIAVGVKEAERSYGFIVDFNSKGDELTKIYFDAQVILSDVEISSDSGIIAAGWAYNSGTLNIDGQSFSVGNNEIIKFEEIDRQGIKEIDAHTFGTTKNDYIACSEPTSDGGYIVGGYYGNEDLNINEYTINGENVSYNGLLVKYKSNGTMAWVKNITSDNTGVRIQSISEDNDGNYIVVGYFYGKLSVDGFEKTSVGSSDSLIIKLDKKGNIISFLTFGSYNSEALKNVKALSDGGFVVVGNYYGNAIQLNGDVQLPNKGIQCGIVIKYDSNMEAKWARVIDGSYNEITRVLEGEHGEIYVGGLLYGYRAYINNDMYIYSNNGGTNGYIAKYDSHGDPKWIKLIGNNFDFKDMTLIDGGDIVIVGIVNNGGQLYYSGTTMPGKGWGDGGILRIDPDGNKKFMTVIGGTNNDYIYTVCKVANGGYVIGGECYQGFSLGKGVNIINEGHYAGIMIKYDSENNPVWADSWKGSGYSEIININSLLNNKLLVIGDYSQNLITDSGTFTSNGSDDIVIARYKEVRTVNDTTELVISNERKVYNIKTRVTGGSGSITGSGMNPYEVVKHGDQNIKEIKMTPSSGYEIKRITINGEEQLFESNEDRTYILPPIEDIQEDKEVTVEYIKSQQKMVIDKVDSDTKENITGAKFKIDQIEEREEPENVIGELTDNSRDFYYVNETDEEPECVGTMTDNGELYYTLKNTNISIGSFYSQRYFYYNSYSQEYYTSSYSNNSTTSAYFKIDLSNYSGKYKISLSAKVSSEANHDFGYATITSDTNVPSLNNTDGRFCCISGDVDYKDYFSDVLEGGNIYYLHLVYVMDASRYSGNNEFRIKNIKINKCTDEGTALNFVDDEGVYKSTNNSKNNSTSNSYIPIDLTGKDGRYEIDVDYIISSGSGDYGYATITENTNRPAYSDSEGRFIYTYGNAESSAKKEIEGGKIYYLHFGYYKDGSGASYDDQFTIKSVRLFKMTMFNCNFIEDETAYVSDNKGRDDTESNSYIPIDLRECTGKYNLIVNAEVSSQSGDYGYAGVSQSTTVPYSRFISITGSVPAKNYSTVLNGGNLYYLHLGYKKDSSGSAGSDSFKVNSVNVALNSSDLKHVVATTNILGKAIVEVPFGKYLVTETEAPNGYHASEPVIVEYRDSENNTFTIENEKTAKVLVHHYIKDTETSVAEDELIEGREGEEYKTVPKLDIDGYELEKDEDGEYVLPENLSGTFSHEDQEVIFYYVKKPVPLTVHHYLDGTVTKVTLADGTPANDEYSNGDVGEEYTTKELDAEELEEKFELTEIPENRRGVYVEPEVEVTYYYGVKNLNIVTSVDSHEEMDALGQTILVKGGTITGEEDDVYEVVEYKENSTKEIKAIPDPGYEVREITINDEPIEFITEDDGSVTLNKFTEMTEDKNVVVLFGREQGTVKVNHYLEGTEERITDLDGNIVEQEVKRGDIGSIYATKERDDLIGKYELVSAPEITSGQYSEEEAIYNYYYRIREYSYTVEYFYNGIQDNLATETGEAQYGDVIENYENKPKEGYEFEEVVGIPLTISDTEPNVIKVYYLPIRNITVKHIDKNTGEVIDTEEKHGKQGYTVTTSAKDIDEYMLVEKPDIEEYTYTEEDQTVKYYYAKVSSGVLEKHLDLITGNPVAEDVFYEGYEGKHYETSTKEIEGYTLTTNKELYQSIVKESPEFLSDLGYESLVDFFADTGLVATEEYIPEDAEGEMEEGLITVRYYYTPIVKLIVKYKDILTGAEIEENVEGELVDSTISRTGNMDDPYTTVEKTFENYLGVSNKTYYRMYLTNHPEVLEEAEVETLEEYLEKENIDPKAPYVPENSEGTFEIKLNEDGTYSKEITVTYYYGPEREVTVKYYDKNTGEEISEETVKVGPDGDEYDLKDTGKEVEGYTLVEEPENPNGIYQEENEERKFYYAKNTQVKVQYVDKDTKEIIDTRANYTIDGYVGKAYETDKKTFDNYNFVSNTKNAKGEMTEDTIEVIYYYSKAQVPTPQPNPTPTPKPTPQPSNNKTPSTTQKRNIVQRIVNPKTGDMVPVVAYTTIFVVLAANIMLAKYNRRELAKVTRVSRMSKMLESDRAKANGKEQKEKAWVKTKKARRAK